MEILNFVVSFAAIIYPELTFYGGLCYDAFHSSESPSVRGGDRQAD